jgi:hypothetical protein
MKHIGHAGKHHEGVSIMRLPIALTSILVAASLLPVPAFAAPLGAAFLKGVPAAAQSADDGQIVQVQHRRGGGPRRGGGGGGHRGGGGGDGGAVAAGILGGLLLGAIIANEAQRNRGVDWCARRFRSYDPYSQTYLGRDGYRHRCP